jgi:hypothetical protein
MSEIPSTPADGNVKVVFVPAIADTAAPKLSELTAASVVDISCYLTEFTPSVDESEIEDERLCSTETFEQPGRIKHSLEGTYIDNTNSPDDDQNAAAETLVRGVVGFIVQRRGVPFDTAFAADQKVKVWPIKAGVQNSVAPEANSVLKTQQKFFVTGKTTDSVVAA